MEGESKAEVSGLKIVTYNVNGLRSRVSQHGSLLNLLNSLDADIICFQETKLSKQDVSADVTIAPGYETFISCTRTANKGRTSYSGVATFCRVKSPLSTSEVTLPLAAEEGITSLLRYSEKRELEKSGFLEGLDVTIDDLLKVDNEGRCIITDHGHFVLFNLYGPRAADDDKERIQFKFLFYLVLQKRWEYLLHLGKRVFVVGDLNIAPTAIDRCDAKPGFEDNRFRRWLRSLLVEHGGPFRDCFRTQHPDRKEAYTCWAQNTGAEVFNFGSRIDHIIISGPCFHHLEGHDKEEHNLFECHVEECDIMMKFKRGQHFSEPKWKGGRSIKLEGSDHAPVFAFFKDVPSLPVHSVPLLAARYIPELRGKQQTIVSVLMKKQVSTSPKHYEEQFSSERDLFLRYSGSGDSDGMESRQCNGTLEHPQLQHELQNACSTKRPVTVSEGNESQKKESLNQMAPARKKKKQNVHSQLSIRSFFQQTKTPSCAVADCCDPGTSHGLSDMVHMNHSFSCVTESFISCGEVPKDEDVKSLSQGQECCLSLNDCGQDRVGAGLESQKRTNNIAFLEWRNLQQRMQNSLPLCRGHGEPCVSRSVKKAGPNIGRGFYVCARAEGPESNPEANCGHFEWASSRSRSKKG